MLITESHVGNSSQAATSSKEMGLKFELWLEQSARGALRAPGLSAFAMDWQLLQSLSVIVTFFPFEKVWTFFSVGAVISAFSECRCNRLSQQRFKRQMGKEVTLLFCWSEVLFFASLVESTPLLQVQNWPLSIEELLNVLNCTLLTPKISCKITGFCL